MPLRSTCVCHKQHHATYKEIAYAIKQLAEVMPAFICNTCGLELSSKHKLQCHIDRKFPCVPPGQTQYECKPCDKQFKAKNLMDQHLATEKHKRAVAAIEAAAGATSSVVTSESHNTTTSHNTSHVHSHNTTITNNYNVHARP